MKKPSALFRAPLVAALSAALLLSGTAAVAAAPTEPSAGTSASGSFPTRGCQLWQYLPDRFVSIQLYTFAEYVGFGSDEATLDRLRRVLAELADIGYRYVEPYTFNGLTAVQYRALLREYGLRATSRHGNTDEAKWEAELADSKTLGQDYVGSGGSAAPGLGSYPDTLATAATLDRLGKRSVRNGTGKVFVHNHQPEFRAKYTDPKTGRTYSAWEWLVRNTDPRYVTFELDVLWAHDAGVDVPRLIKQYRHRIELLHIKDGMRVGDEVVQQPLGEGILDLPAILAAARWTTRYYVVEQDPVFFGEVDDMLDEARISFDYLDCRRR